MAYSFIDGKVRQIIVDKSETIISKTLAKKN